MANLRVKQALERLSNELASVVKQVEQYSGAGDSHEAIYIDNLATDIAESAARIGAAARMSIGDRSGKTLVKSVRKSLGFSRP